MPWYSVFSCFIFLFRSNGKKEHLDENDFRHGYGKLFPKFSSDSYLISVIFKVLSQQLRGTLTTAFERYFTVEVLRAWLNIHANSFLGKSHEMKMGEGA